MTKFLIIRFSSIGDIVLTTPVVRCLKLQYQDSEVHFATKKSYQSLVENNIYIDKFHLLGKNEKEFILQLKAEKFDYVIDLHHNLRTLKIKWSLGVKSFSFNKLNFEKWLIVNFKINLLPPIHIVDRYLQTVKYFDVKNDGKGLDYFIPAKDVVIIEKFVHSECQNEQNSKITALNFVAFAIGGQHFTKKLPIAKMVDLVKKINRPVILLGGKEDFLVGEELRKIIGENVFNACGKLNLNQSASILQQALQVVSHDTGLMHIAAAFGKSIVSIWGNTIPAFGMYPYLSENKEEGLKIIENNYLGCRPCSKIGFNTCPKGHFKCMNELVFEENFFS